MGKLLRKVLNELEGNRLDTPSIIICIFPPITETAGTDILQKDMSVSYMFVILPTFRLQGVGGGGSQ